MATATRDGAPLPRLGLVLLVALTLVWGFNWPVMKVALSEISPWTFRVLCTVCGAAGLFALCRIAGISVAVPRGRRLPLLLLSVFNITLWNICSAYGVSLLPAGRAAIIAFTMPVWVVLLGSLFLGEPITRRRFAALALGMAGLAVLIGPDLVSLKQAPLGALFMCAAALNWAIGTVIIKRYEWNVPVIALVAWQLAIGGIPIVIGRVVLEGFAVEPVSGAALLAVAYNVLICFIFGNYAWVKIVSLFPAGIAGISTLPIPIIGVFAGAFFLDEPVGLQEVAALVLVVSALAAVFGHRTGALRRRAG